MYKLFTDKTELFECNISLQGASLKKSKARLVVETQDYSLMFNGSISNGGKCEIPIRKLKGLIDEDTIGNIRLEVIAEDTFFTPWESDFEVETSKKVTVEVKTQNTKKPIIEAKAIVKENTNLYPKFIINKSLTDLTTADTSITVNRSAGSISSESQIFYMHGQSVSGQRWNQIASGVTITEVSDPGTNIGTVTKLDGYIKSDGTFGAENTYQNTAINVIQLTVPVSGTMPSNNQTSILSAAVTSNLVQL